MPSSRTMFFCASVIDATESNSLRSSTAATLKRDLRRAAQTPRSDTRSGESRRRKYVVDRRQVLGRLTVDLDEHVADLHARGFRRAAGHTSETITP